MKVDAPTSRLLPRLLIAVLCVLGVHSALPVLAFGDLPRAKSVEQPADGGEELGTVVLDLNNRIGTFRQWLDQAQATKLPPDFPQRVAKLADLRKQAETNLSARAEYESQFSSILVEFDGALGAFVGGEAEATQRINEMESSLQDGKARMDAAANASAAAHAEHTKRATAVAASLTESGRKAKAIIDAGGIVPPEAQAAALQAEGMRETAQFLADVEQAKNQQAVAAAAELAGQLQDIKALRASFAEDFNNAKNARAKTSAVAGFRKQITDASALALALADLKKAHRKVRPVDTNAFRPLADLGPGQSRPGAATGVTPVDNRGLKLMLDYANKPQNPAVKTTSTTRPTEVKP